jgi:UDP-glucose 4-epimerase
MNASRRILITGAGGFVCSSIARVLLEHNWQVIAVDRQFDATWQQSFQDKLGDQILFVQTDSATLPDIKVDALLHGAAITASPEDLGQTPEANFRANIEPLLAVSEWAVRQSVKRTLFISSSAVYNATDPGAVSETFPTSPGGLYAVAKQTMESFVATLRDVYGRDVATIRLSNIYGPDEQPRPTRPRASLVAQMVQQALQNEVLTVYQDDPVRDWTYSPDIGVAVASLLEQPSLNHALYNVASEQVLAPFEIGMTIKSLISDVVLDVREGANPNVPPLTRRGYLSHQRLQEETGFTGWTAFKDGLQKIIAEQQPSEIAS